MAIDYKPFIPASSRLPEITLKAFLLGIILAAIMAVSNTYLALKIGVLTPSSIPAAILSMGILRLFKKHNILENNQVQTCASAGEAIAGGVVYTAPALVIIHYAMGFNYFSTFLIALVGGMLGVLFTIPLRKVYMNDEALKFPEGRAVAEVLKIGEQKSLGLKSLLMGGAIGAVIELFQNGLKVFSSAATFFSKFGSSVFGYGAGFSATLLGAGYLVGFDVGFSILVGAVIASGIAMPILSHYVPATVHGANAIGAYVAGNDIRYIGIGAMLVAGLFTLILLVKPFFQSLMKSVSGMVHAATGNDLRTEKDLSTRVLLLGILSMFVVAYVLFQYMFPLQAIGVTGAFQPLFILLSLLYVLISGFIFAAICGYFSGLVGVTASPGSSVAIAAVLIAALIVRAVMTATGHVSMHDLKIGAGITIILASVVMGAACVANNNSNDLKVGHVVGATPFKQQLMLMVGGLVAALIIPVVMQLLYQVYGIAGAMPHAGMDVAASLPAPPAAAMGAIAQGVFQQDLPYGMIGLGGAIAVVMILVKVLVPKKFVTLSVIGIAVGMYLPLSSSTPIFIGALLSLLVKHGLKKRNADAAKAHTAMIISCGLVAGAALMNVILAIPFSMMHNPNAMSVMPSSMHGVAEVLGAVVTLGLVFYVYRKAVK